MDVKALIQNKGTGYWLCAAASACALVVGIIVLATQGMALTVDVAGQGWTVSVMLFIGFAVNVVLTFFPMRFASAVSVLFYSIAFGFAINLALGAIADQINQVHYQGGDFGMTMFYVISTFIIAALCIVACFFAQTKNGKAVL